MKRQHVAMLLLPGLTLVAVMFFLPGVHRKPAELCIYRPIPFRGWMNIRSFLQTKPRFRHYTASGPSG